ncbi:hypothetical protein ZWY2020_024940 [Hordeum vulgare]|nr:hypothetical protein ZWY2020_024940 [Hordeum vulgare]
MDNTPAWQRAINDLTGADHVARVELKEITRWFPSVQMLRNHVCGIIEMLQNREGHAHDGSISLVVLSDDELEEVVEVVAPIVNARQGDRNLPIDVELLSDAPLVPKKEAVAAEEDKSKKRNKMVVVPENVRRSERLKMLNK